MTELLYYQDAYCQNFDATITAAETHDGKTRLALDRTAFYPGGGGQPNDEGQLIVAGNVYPVVKVNKEGGQLWHTTITGSSWPGYRNELYRGNSIGNAVTPSCVPIPPCTFCVASSGVTMGRASQAATWILAVGAWISNLPR